MAAECVLEAIGYKGSNSQVREAKAFVGATLLAEVYFELKALRKALTKADHG